MRAPFAVALLAATVVSAQAGRAHAGAGFIPPLRVDVGSDVMSGPEGAQVASDLSLGIHWASLHPGEPSFDVGIGMMTRLQQDQSAPMARHASAEPAPYVGAMGGYLELAKRIAGGRHWRAWLGARGDVSRADVAGRTVTMLGAAGRITTELFTGVVGSSSRALVLGTFAVGLYVEAAVREQPDDTTGHGVGCGLSARLPLVFAVD